MKILVVNLDKKIFEPGSASLERLKLYAGFCQKMKVVVLTLQKFVPIKHGNLEVYATGSNSRFSYFSDARKLIEDILKQEKMDLIMTQDPFETGPIGWLTKRKYKLPWQCQVHGDIFNPPFSEESFSNKLKVLLAKFLLPKADGIRVVSERIKKSISIKKYRLKTDPVVLPIFVDVEKFKSVEIKADLKKKYPQFDFVALIASRLGKEKNISLAIRAFSEIVQKHPKAGLVIVGDGAEKENLKRLSEILNLQSKIIFEPWSNDLASYYKTADLFLLTSNYEGWGMAVIEAAACACPIVMTDVGCAREFIKDGVSGLIVPVGDKMTLVRAIERIISDENFGKRIGLTAQETAKSLPSQEKYLEMYKKSFADIISTHKL